MRFENERDLRIIKKIDLLKSSLLGLKRVNRGFNKEITHHKKMNVIINFEINKHDSNIDIKNLYCYKNEINKT